MLAQNVDIYREIIASISFVKNIRLFHQENNEIIGDFEVEVNESSTLPFSLKIFPSYPYKLGNNESIKFFNEDLISYKHVMCDGSICIHTVHGTILEKKLKDDFDSLKNWIEKYYVNHETETYYEHLIIQGQTTIGRKNAFLFTDVEHKFGHNEFGDVALSLIDKGYFTDTDVQNSIVNYFSSNHNKFICGWSKDYQNPSKLFKGTFIFLCQPPAIYGKCLFKNWDEFNNIIPDIFIRHLQNLEKDILTTNTFMPLFIGYPTIPNEIHWQVALLKVGSFPLRGMPIYKEGRKTGKWETKFKNEAIDWCISNNCSRKYFFGRGTFEESIISKKILVIGVGAIGSILATTLARCGARYIDIIDYDLKEPENVCRSEYEFITGVGNKTDELRIKLCSISPFVEVNILRESLLESEIKWTNKLAQFKTFYNNCLSNYDIIFDCSTDDDLMHILNDLEFQGELWNLSITNHAKEMVVGLHPNIYNFVTNQFNYILKNDSLDLHNPTGCWNPTFKANYNDINLLVQTALKQINLYYKNNLEKKCFTIHSPTNENLNLEIKEY